MAFIPISGAREQCWIVGTNSMLATNLSPDVPKG